MSLQEIRARFFNPERWIVMGLTWAALTLGLVSLIDLALGTEFASHNWFIRIPVLAIGGLVVGWFFRKMARRAQKNAR